MKVHVRETVDVQTAMCAQYFLQFLQVSLFHHSKIGLLSQRHIVRWEKKITDPQNALQYFVSSESHLIKITSHPFS